MGAGLSALIRIGAELEHEFGSIEVIEIGRPATGPEQDFTMQVCGRWLFYTVALYGPQIHLSAQPMDTGDPPDLLLRDRDNERLANDARCHRRAGTDEIKSLERPIEAAGEDRDDANGWVIA